MVVLKTTVDFLLSCHERLFLSLQNLISEAELICMKECVRGVRLFTKKHALPSMQVMYQGIVISRPDQVPRLYNFFHAQPN